MSDTKAKVRRGIDKAAAKTKVATDKGIDKAKEAARSAGNAITKAGEKLKQAGKK